MSNKDNVVGEVRIKVSPDTRGFRGETDQGIDRELQGYRPNVTVEADADTRKAQRKLDGLSADVKAHLDTTRARRDLESLRDKAREALKLGDIEFDTQRGKKVTDFMATLRKELGEIDKGSIEKAFQDRMRFPGFNDAESLKAVRQLQEWKKQFKSIRDLNRQFKSEVADSGFKDVQKLIDKLSGSGLRTARLSEIFADDTQTDALYNKTRRLADQWERLDKAQRSSVQNILQSRDNLAVQRMFRRSEELRRQFEQMDTIELNNIKLNGGAAADDAAAEIRRRLSEAQARGQFDVRARMTYETDDMPRRDVGDLQDGRDQNFYNNLWGPQLDEAELLRKELDRLMGKAGSFRGMQQIRLKYDLDEESAKHTLHRAKKVKQEIDDMKAQMQVEPTGLSVLAAQMQWASRPRTVNFFVKVNQKSMAIAEGLLKSLAGVNVLRKSGQMLESLLVKFDQISIMTGAITAVVAGVTDTLAYAATSALAIGEGMLRSVGVLAMAPAALSAIAGMAVINIAAFEGIKEAIDGDVEAMAKLPPEAQKFAKALQGSWSALQKPVQKAFWESAGNSLATMVDTLLPRFTKGLTDAAVHAGSFAGDVAEAMTAAAPDIETMLQNLSEMFDNATGMATPLTDAVNTLGLRGSYWLPKFGTWLTEISTGFNNWIQAADEAGDIDRWIREGVQSLKDMWSVGNSVVDMFRAMTRVATDAGAGGLPGLRKEMEKISTIMMNEPFQSRMTTIFSGAREGASLLNRGVKDLGSELGVSARWFSKILMIGGELGGLTFTNIANMISTDTFQRGTLEGLTGMRDMLRDMGPAFANLGDIIGNLAKISAPVFRALGDMFVVSSGIIADAADTVSDNLAELAPKAIAFVTSFLGAAGPMLQGIVTIANGALRMFLDLPPAISGVISAIGVFLLLRNSFAGFFSKIDGSQYFQRLRGQWIEQQALAGKTVEQMGKFSATNAILGDMAARWGNVWRSLAPVTVEINKLNQTELMQKWQGQLTNVGQWFTTMGVRAGDGLGVVGQRMADLGRSAWGGLQANMTEINAGFGRLADRASATFGPMAARIAPVAGQFRELAGAVGNVASAMGSAAGRGLLAAGNGLMGALGGPWGLAITAGITLITAFGAANAKSKSQVDALTQAIRNQDQTAISESVYKKWSEIDSSTTDNVLRNINKITNFGFAPMRKAGNEAADSVGILQEAITKSIVDGNGEQLAKDFKTLSTAAEGYGSMSDEAKAAMERLGISMSKSEVRDHATDFQVLGEQVGKTADMNEIAGYKAEQYAKGITEVKAATSPAEVATSQFAEAVGILGDEMSTADEKARALDTALGILSGETPDVDVAMRTLHDTFRDAAGIFKDAEGKVISFAGVVDPLTGKINTVSEAGSTLSKSLESFTRDTKSSAEALAGSGAGFDAVKKHLSDQRDAWVATATSALGSKEAAEAAYDFMIKGSPDEIATLLTVDPKGVEEGVAYAERLLGQMELRRSLVKIGINKTELQDGIVGAMGDLGKLNEIVATAHADLNPEQLRVKQQEVVDLLFELAKKNPTIAVDMDASIFQQKRDGIIGELEVLDMKEPTPEVKLRITELETQLALVNQMIATREGTAAVVKITGEPSGWDAVVAAVTATGNQFNATTFMAWLDANKDKFEGKKYTAEQLGQMFAAENFASDLDGDTSKLNIKLSGAYSSGQQWGREWFHANLAANDATYGGFAAADRFLTANWSGRRYTATLASERVGEAANGAFVPGRDWFSKGFAGAKFFANGGFENHVAQIAQPGVTPRVWAEAETGGEAYLPLSMAKRARSTQILDKVATMFGYTLTRKDGKAYKDGGIEGGRQALPTMTTGGATVNIDTYVQESTSSADDVARALLRRVKTSGLSSITEGF